jgi:MoaA/NifB/PqqE/SkfB family radical SAM enzyme
MGAPSDAAEHVFHVRALILDTIDRRSRSELMKGPLTGVRSRLGLLRGLIDGERAYTGPAYVTLDMTTRCNSVCLGCLYHCAQPRQTSVDKRVMQDLPLELVRQLAPELARMLTREVMLAGEGEPLLHAQFSGVVTSFKQAGLIVRSFTNGTLIDEVMADQIVHSGLDELNITFWAVNRAEHLVWHPGVNPEFLERRKRGIQFLRRARLKARESSLRINLQMPLNRSNFGNIRERVQLARESGCERVTFSVFRDFGGPFENLCLSRADGESMRHDLLYAGQQLERAGIAHNVGSYLDRVRFGGEAWRACPCYAGWFEAYVKVDGSVLACCRCRLVMGKLTERRFSEVWNSPAYRDFRRRSSDPRLLAQMGPECNCANCCHWHDNRRVHRLWRYIAPLTPRSRKAAFRKSKVVRATPPPDEEHDTPTPSPPKE